jgi:phospholipase C
MLKKYIYAFGLFTFIITSVLKAEQIQQDLMQSKIKHVVVLMLENRSFDNIMAWLYNENNPPSRFIPTDTQPVFLGLSEETLNQYCNVLKNSKGEVVFSCPPIKGVPSVQSTKFLNSPQFDPNESFPYVHTQIFGIDGSNVPTMKGFLQDYASLWKEEEWMQQQQQICAVMETYTDKELPFLYGLARHYAVSDLWFSSVPTQTNPNRAFTFCGSSEGEVINGYMGKNLFQADTLWNRLAEESSETTWSIFWQSDMLPFILPGPYSGINSFASLQRIPNVYDHFQTLDHFHELARNGQLPDVSFLEPQWTLSLNANEMEVLQFLQSSQDFVVGFEGNDFHPPCDIRSGENFLANIYTSLSSNKESWNQTLFIVLFDEHGGLFDHVPPPAAIPPDDKFQHGFQFDRYGVRVPAIFISPLIEKGTIIRSSDPNVPFDHTSLIATILKWKNIGKSKWNLGRRVDAAPTFENVIALAEPRKDCIIGYDSAPISQTDVVCFGDTFHLCNKEREYVCAVNSKYLYTVPVGASKDAMSLTFIGGSGTISHGCLSLIKSQDPILGDANLLETQAELLNCLFNLNAHLPRQWWTIKKVGDAFLGSEICYGDKIFIENHSYLDLLQLVPGRLSHTQGWFNQYLSLKPIILDDSDTHYWIIERP